MNCAVDRWISEYSVEADLDDLSQPYDYCDKCGTELPDEPSGLYEASEPIEFRFMSGGDSFWTEPTKFRTWKEPYFICSECGHENY